MTNNRVRKWRLISWWKLLWHRLVTVGRAGGGLASVTTGDRVSLAAGPRATDWSGHREETLSIKDYIKFSLVFFYIPCIFYRNYVSHTCSELRRFTEVRIYWLDNVWNTNYHEQQEWSTIKAKIVCVNMNVSLSLALSLFCLSLCKRNVWKV